MTESYSKERLALLDLLLKGPEVMASGRLWTLAPGNLRFRYGESLAELKVPYHLGADDEACIEDAVQGIAALLKKRYQEAQGVEGAELASGMQPVMKPQLREKTFKTDILLPDSLEKRVAKEVLRTTPVVDGSILSSWLGPDGPGKKFVFNGWSEWSRRPSRKRQTSRRRKGHLILPSWP
jgi:hypothetical protein